MSNPTPKEIEAWKASAEVFAEWWEEEEIFIKYDSQLNEVPDDWEVHIFGGENQYALTAGHIREVIKLCRTK